MIAGSKALISSPARYGFGEQIGSSQMLGSGFLHTMVTGALSTAPTLGSLYSALSPSRPVANQVLSSLIH